MHLIRRNLPLIYIIEDNGVYGLTKGQFSATADLGSTLKNGRRQRPAGRSTPARWPSQLGATFVAPLLQRRQEAASAMLKAAIAHRGTAMIDVISPCVTFNDHEGSTKSYSYMKDHEEPIHECRFVPSYEDIAVEYDPGATVPVKMHDGSRLQLRKLEEGYDPRDKLTAVTRIMSSHAQQEVLTGVLYVNTELPNFYDLLGLPGRAPRHAAPGGDPAAEEGAGRGDGLARLDLPPRLFSPAGRRTVRPPPWCSAVVARTLSMQVARGDPDSPDAARLLEAYLIELRERLAPVPVEVVARWADEFRDPDGAVVLGRVEGRSVGCAGLRPVGESTLELKHFFLLPDVRGRGLGRVLLAGVEAVARALGARRILLDTAAPLLEAAALYRSAGYREIPRYNDNPHAVAWFERAL